MIGTIKNGTYTKESLNGRECFSIATEEGDIVEQIILIEPRLDKIHSVEGRTFYNCKKLNF